ncbi:BatA and WFA domain-containing protein [Neobacillus niacini]|uniref:vWA domain-containing protein n=1 Tax=Neobacillus niacini TaxID=86668 RepID=UPI0021CB33BA|nr:BatA and WFA domain-containing protein [Neobacillus niacini]MCM3767945.1 BatA and WFA domain-containing protein [Neobacillus niacini]
MNFANPIFFSLVVFIAFVVVLYFFRKQYQAVMNPSNLLWQQAMNEWKASPWLQKLQQNLLFWLQIIALTLLMLSLAKPVWFSKGVEGEQIIWIVDTSATMSAISENHSALDEAKREMKQMAGRLKSQEVTIIKAGDNPAILLNREMNPTVIGRTIDNLSVTYEHENIDKAVRLAESLVAKQETVIHIFTDSSKRESLETSLNDVAYEIHNSQVIQDNIAILSFGVAQKENGISALAVLENQGKEPKTFPLTVSSEGTVVFQQQVTAAPGEQLVINIPDLPQRKFYQAKIETNDHYAADNEQTAVYFNLSPDVFAVGEVNPFFIKGLETIGIKVTQLDSSKEAEVPKTGIMIAEGLKREKLPNLPVIFINKPKETEDLIELKDSIVANDSPLTQYVDTSKTYIKYAASPIEGNWDTIMDSGSHPLIQTGSINGKPAILLNFSLEHSDWPLQPGFPIFLFNSYQWLAKQTGFLGYFQPGEVKRLQLGEGQTALEVFNDAGKSLSSFDLVKENFTAPVKPGVYQAVTDGQISYFTVQLDDREKKLKSAPSFSLNSTKTEGKKQVVTVNDSIWFWLAAIALVLLALEWEVYRRGFRA